MHLLVVGNAAVDRSYLVDALPGDGDSVLAGAGHLDQGGKGFNQAVMAARAGARVAFATVLGDDASGQALRVTLAAEGIDTRFTATRAGPSDESIALVDRTGANCIVTTTSAVRTLTPADVAAAVRAMPRGAWLLLQGNLTIEATAAAVDAAVDAGLRTAFNPSPLDAAHGSLLERVALVVANAVEARALGLGPHVPAVITLGAAGARLQGWGAPVAVPAPVVEAVDTVGAGDVLAGVLVARLARGVPPTEALGQAVAAAVLQVRRRGTFSAFPSRDAIGALGP